MLSLHSVHDYPASQHFRGNPEVDLLTAEKVVIKIQSVVRRNLAAENFTQVLWDARLEKAKALRDDPEKLARAPKALNHDEIYMPDELPVVIRADSTGFDDPRDRFIKMQAANTLCREKHLRHLVVPRAIFYNSSIIEERLPNDHNTTIKGMGFYYENRAHFTKAIAEFTSFLCFASLSDLIGGNSVPLNCLGYAEVPRFDNLLLYETGEKKKLTKLVSLI